MSYALLQTWISERGAAGAPMRFDLSSLSYRLGATGFLSTSCLYELSVCNAGQYCRHLVFRGRSCAPTVSNE